MPSTRSAGGGRDSPQRSCSVSGYRGWRPPSGPPRDGSRIWMRTPTAGSASEPGWIWPGPSRPNRRGTEVPFKDPEDRRRYDRERKRLLRAQEAGRPALATPVRLKVAQDVEALLDEAVRTIRADRKAKGVDRARALTQVASVALRLIEAHALQDRLDAVEQVLRLRSA